jgi:glycosyltransferase involved in cell wall biosynthesis
MACGVPVVASNSSSLPEHVLDGETGLLCSPGDVGGFADAVRRIASRPAVKEAMGARARLHAVERFDQRLSLARYLEVIESMRTPRERAA